jgi:hypothetical protein
MPVENLLEELFLEALVVVSLTPQVQQLEELGQVIKDLLEEMVRAMLEIQAWVPVVGVVLHLPESAELEMSMEAMEDLVSLQILAVHLLLMLQEEVEELETVELMDSEPLESVVTVEDGKAMEYQHPVIVVEAVAVVEELNLQDLHLAEELVVLEY